MTRKPLPKAITRTLEDLQEIGAGVVTSQELKRPAVRIAPEPPPDKEAPAPQAISPHHMAEVASAPAVASPPLAGELLPPASIDSEQQTARRRAVAHKVVERHRMYAAAGGLFPVPVVNVAGVTAINLRMVKALSDIYGVPFERDRTRSIIMGLMGGAGPTGLAAATGSALAFIVPGSGLVALAVASFSAAAFTRGIGRMFVQHFENENKGGQ